MQGALSEDSSMSKQTKLQIVCSARKRIALETIIKGFTTTRKKLGLAIDENEESLELMYIH